MSIRDSVRGSGIIVWRLRRDGVVTDRGTTGNLITQNGSKYFAMRASGVASPPAQVTGMQLGTGSTNPAYTGAAAAIGSYISGSDKAIDASHPQTVTQGNGWRVTWYCLWAAGEATNSFISEVVLVNRTLDGSAATESQTIARALLSPVADKTSSHELDITWYQDISGV